MENYTKRVVTSLIIVFILTGFTSFFAYLFRIVMARNLTITEYGMFYSIISLLGVFTVIRDFGYSDSLSRFIPLFKNQGNIKSIKNIVSYISLIVLTVSFLIFIGVLIFSKYIVVNYLKMNGNEDITLVVILLSFYFFLMSGELILKQSFLGFQKMNYFSSISLVRIVLTLFLSYFSFKLGFNLLGVVYSHIFAVFITLLIFGYLFFKKVFPPSINYKLSWDKTLIKEISYFALPTIITMAASSVIIYSDSIMLTYMLGVGAVGLYNVAQPTANLISVLTSPLRFIIFPLSSELWSKKYKDKLILGISMIYKYYPLIFIPFLVVILLYSQTIISLLFSEKYISASNPLIILSAGIFFLSLAQINYVIIAGIGKPKLNTITSVLAACLNIILNIILIQKFKITGAAIATSTSYLIMLLYSTFNIKKNVEIILPFWYWIKLIFASIMMFITAYLLKMILGTSLIYISLTLILSLIMYIIIIFSLKLIDIHEIRIMIRQVMNKYDN